MPIPEKFSVDFCESGVYHVFNRKNNKERLFKTRENYLYFLRKYDEYLSPYLDTLAWCLIPNHFHLLVKVKIHDQIKEQLRKSPLELLSPTEKKFPEDQVSISQIIENSFKRFFQSYSLSFNKAYNRKGNLFYKPFKRLKIGKEDYYTRINVVYLSST